MKTLKMKRIFYRMSLSLLLLPLIHHAQVVTTIPVFPVDGDSCSVIFDAALGNAGLNNFTGAIYAHTGVITNLSTSSSDWKYVIAQWNENTTKALLTPLGNNKYRLTIKPSIRAFYGVPEQEEILKMAFVFRNADGSKTGRNADGSDIFADVYPDVLSVNITTPAEKELFLKVNASIIIAAVSPGAENMKILLNGTSIKTSTGENISDTIAATGSFWTQNTVRIESWSATENAADSFYFSVIPDAPMAELPAGISDGINYTGASTATLCLHAPGKDHVFVAGEFNNWTMEANHYMNKTPDGNRFWVEIGNLVPGQEYIFQYVVDGQIRIGDPYADKVSDPNDKYIAPTTYPGLKPYPQGKAQGIATYLQTSQEPFVWSSLPFTPPAISDLVIFELLIRDFTKAHDYPSLIDTLDYLKNLGVNAIELMPVMEFEGNESWGYNVNYSFAVDKYYGTKNGLKHFIDVCHSKGIAVILDIVCNHHFGSSPLAMLYWDATNQRPAGDNPWFNPIPKHPYNVGNDFNHESPATRVYMERLIRYWLTEFHIDGYRFDLSKGFTQKNSYPDNVGLWGQYDESRINILKNYTSVIHSVNPQAYAIMEHFADNSEEKVLAANNMMLWGNLNYNYIQAAGGWTTGTNSDLSWGSYKQRGWSQPQLVTYMESHDEERVMYRNIAAGNSSKPPYNIRDTNTALKRIELNANFFIPIPGPKMIWQFGELGYDYSIEYGGGRLASKPVRWDYLDQWRRRYSRNVFSALINLKKTLPVFRTSDYSTDLTGNIKRIWLRDNSMDVTILGNFDVVSKEVTPDFTKTGWWYEFYSGDSIDVQNVSAKLMFKPGEYRLYSSVRLQKPLFTAISDLELPKEADPMNLEVFPNPSEGEISIRFTTAENITGCNLTLSDLWGRPLGQKRITGLQGRIHLIEMNINSLTQEGIRPGIYLIRLSEGHSSSVAKLVIR